MVDWHPIETAPRDMTIVRAHDRIGVVRYWSFATGFVLAKELGFVPVLWTEADQPKPSPRALRLGDTVTITAEVSALRDDGEVVALKYDAGGGKAGWAYVPTVMISRVAPKTATIDATDIDGTVTFEEQPDGTFAPTRAN